MAQKSLVFSKASFGSTISAVPHHLPDAETGKRVREAARVGSGKALAALRRSVRTVIIAKYFSMAVKGTLRLQQEDQAGASQKVSCGGCPMNATQVWHLGQTKLARVLLQFRFE